MSATEELFLKELAALFRKYQIVVEESDNYDVEENYQGTTYYLSGRNGIYVSVSELESLIKKAG